MASQDMEITFSSPALTAFDTGCVVMFGRAVTINWYDFTAFYELPTNVKCISYIPYVLIRTCMHRQYSSKG